jgi:hypothetical protein
MSLFISRVAIATAVLCFGVCHVSFAQTSFSSGNVAFSAGNVSFGIGNAAHREAEHRILRAFDRRDSFVIEDMPFTTFVQLLRDRFDINVLIDKKALDDFGIDTATPVSIQLRSATLESAVNVVLESLELTWTIQHEALQITTPEEAEARLETRLYPVRDLVLIELERTVDADFDSLIELITSAIHPDTWDEVGGPGAIESEYASMSLVISQTWSVHRQLDQLLTSLRTARDSQGISPVRTGSQRAAVTNLLPWPAGRYRSSATSTWQQPRVYD